MTELVIPLITRRATRLFARQLAPLLEPGDLLILNGPLGSGKTFLTRALAHALGLPPRTRVTSPTFALVQELETQPPLVHADLYRLNNPAQLRDLGLRDRRSDAVLVVEWGEPYIDGLGGDALMLQLTREPRRCTVSAHGPSATQRVEALRQRIHAPIGV